MKTSRFILKLTVLFSFALILNACKEDNPTQQSIRIVNDTDLALDQVLLQSSDETLTFTDLLPDSTSSYQLAENIQSTFLVEILVDDNEISLTWKLPDDLNDVLDGKVFRSGDYEFAVSSIDTSNSTAVMVLSEYFIQD